jgi:PleD family two-component response regulator
VSIGVVTVAPPRDRGSETLTESAQRALATAKERGGNMVIAGVIG